MNFGRPGGMLIASFVVGMAIVAGPAITRYVGTTIDALRPGRASDLAPCVGQYPGGVRPVYVHPGLDRRTTTICYHAFSVGYSGLTRTPLWSAERLTAEAVASAHELARVDDFHPDDHLAGRDQASLDDYRRSGFDRGHMTPSGDMPDARDQDESFTLANVVPQTRELNRHLWSDIEHDVRQLTRTHTTIYVVTGPIFAGAALDSLHGHVAVPTSTYKAVFIPGGGAAAYVATNTRHPQLQIVSIAELRRRVGVDPFPAIGQRFEANAIYLPRPRRRRGYRN